ncbi:MAG: ferredoxin domain-containing protein [Lentihominibacter sp.]|jgi:uncharacterized ferredoxin-like protein
MIQNRETAAAEAAKRVAQAMVAAAITAPKANGGDRVVAAILDGEDKAVLVRHMKDIAEETGAEFFDRDANNVDNSHCIVMLGALNDPVLLDGCGFCGFTDCAESKAAGATCAFNASDLGIAVGSAVSIAADNRMDNRVLFSAGKAFLRMKVFEGVRVCYGIPLSTTSKSIFFDRGPGTVLLD